MKSFYLAFILVPGIHSMLQMERLTDQQIILCGDGQRSFKVEVLDSQRQTARLTYATGGAPIVDAEAAYAQSGAGYDFAVISAGRPVFSALIEPDLRTARVPRNGSPLPCGPAL